MDQDINNFAPRVGVAWDVNGDGKTAVRAGIGQFFLRERLSPVLALAANNPPFVQTISGIRKLDSNVRPCAGCFNITSLARLARAGKSREDAEQLAVEPHGAARGLAQHQLEVGYVGNYGYDLLRAINVERRSCNGDMNRNGVDDRLSTSRAPSRRTLRCGRSACSATTTTSRSGITAASRRTTRSRRSSSAGLGRGSQFQVSYTLVHSRANVAMTDSGQGLAADTAPLDVENPDLDWGRPAAGRTHIFNSSLVWMLPTLDGSSGLKKALLRRLGDQRHRWRRDRAACERSVRRGCPASTAARRVPATATISVRTGRASRARRQAGRRTSRSSIRPRSRSTASSSARSAMPSAATATGPGYFQTDLAFYKNFRLTQRRRGSSSGGTSSTCSTTRTSCSRVWTTRWTHRR